MTCVCHLYLGVINQINENKVFSPIIKFHQSVIECQWLHWSSLEPPQIIVCVRVCVHVCTMSAGLKWTTNG